MSSIFGPPGRSFFSRVRLHIRHPSRVRSPDHSPVGVAHLSSNPCRILARRQHHARVCVPHLIRVAVGGVIPSGSMPIEIGRCSGRSHRRGVRPWYASDPAGSVGRNVKSHWSSNGVCLQCDLIAKPQSKTRDFDGKGTAKPTPLKCNLIHFGETRRPGARCCLRSYHPTVGTRRPICDNRSAFAPRCHHVIARKNPRRSGGEMLCYHHDHGRLLRKAPQ